MYTNIYFKEEARKRMKAGVDLLANAVKCTLGPGGRNVSIRMDNPQHTIIITKDGVTVARIINPADKMEAMGAQIIKDAAEKTAKLAGDGTTTSTLLAQVIIEEGLKSLALNANPVDIKRGMDKAVAIVVEDLKKQSLEVTDEALVQIATIAANNEPVLGGIVAKALKDVGPDGVIYLQPSNSVETYTELQKGIYIDRGYLSPYFVNNKEKMTVEFNNPIILFSERKISILKDIQHILEFANGSNVKKEKRPLLIIAEDVDGEALQTMLRSKLEGGCQFAAIKQPGFGNMQLQMMEDLTIMTGGKMVSQSLGMAWEKVDGAYFGQADKIIITSTSTTIIGARGKKDAIEKRLEEIRALIADNPSEYEKEKLRNQRLAKLTNGIGIIHVGGPTEVEMKEKMDRIDDSRCATKAAMAEGIVAGGGTAYIRAIVALPDHFDNKDENYGLSIIREALKAPLLQIAENAGVASGMVLETVMTNAGNYGYNAKTAAYEDLLKAGVIDPTKVARVALENASSVGGMFLTTECGIVDTKVVE